MNKLIELIKNNKKLAIIMVLVVIVSVPIAIINEKKESETSYKNGIEAIERKDYDQAARLLKKVKKNYS